MIERIVKCIENSPVQLKKVGIKLGGIVSLPLKSQNGWKFENKSTESWVTVYLGIFRGNSSAGSDPRA